MEENNFVGQQATPKAKSSEKPEEKRITVRKVKSTISDIINDPDVKDVLKKLGLDEMDALEILDAKISINPTSKDDVDSFSKSVLKFEVMSVLLQRHREQILDETDEKMHQASAEFTKSYQASLRQGRINRLIATIDKYGGLPSKDGKTYIPLTAEQKEELLEMLKQNEIDMSEFADLIDSIEFEYEEVAPEQASEAPQTPNIEEPNKEEVTAEVTPNVIEENLPEPEEPVQENESKEFSLEENGLRKVNDADKLSAINKNEELQTDKYRTATFYIPEKTMDLDTLAGLALEQKRNNPGENVVIMFGATPIIPEKFTSKAQIIDACRADIAKQQEEAQRTIEEKPTEVQQDLLAKPEVQRAIDNTTSEVIAGQDTLSSLQEDAITIQEEAIEAQLVQEPRANVKTPEKTENDEIDPRQSADHSEGR